MARVTELTRTEAASRRPSLAELAELAERCLPADLPEALPHVLSAIGAGAALDGDVTHLMAALPALARAWRYGDVRGTPAEGLAGLVDSLLARIRAGLSPALTGLDDDSAREMTGHVDAVHAAAFAVVSRAMFLMADVITAGMAIVFAKAKLRNATAA